MPALYNENNAHAAGWLENLSAANRIAPGVVDTRSITELQPDDVKDYTQFHAFAGIGIWSHALRLAGIPDDFPVWSGSCPCTPFSQAGGKRGFDDERHLWPAWFRLIRECRPGLLVGEQVSSKGGLAWLDHVLDDLEREGYTCAALDLCASSVGAPHIRQRLYWVAYASGARRSIERSLRLHVEGPPGLDVARRGSLDGMGDADSGAAWQHPRELQGDEGERALGSEDGRGALEHPGATGGFWADCDWVDCQDGRRRPTQRGVAALAARNPGRLGLLRAYGNAIVAPLAAEFIASFFDTITAT